NQEATDGWATMNELGDGRIRQTPGQDDSLSVCLSCCLTHDRHPELEHTHDNRRVSEQMQIHAPPAPHGGRGDAGRWNCLQRAAEPGGWSSACRAGTTR